jgi:hypothetical protein
VCKFQFLTDAGTRETRHVLLHFDISKRQRHHENVQLLRLGRKRQQHRDNIVDALHAFVSIARPLDLVDPGLGHPALCKPLGYRSLQLPRGLFSYWVCINDDLVGRHGVLAVYCGSKGSEE